MAEKENKTRFSVYLITVICTHLEKQLSHVEVLELHQSDVDERKELKQMHEVLSPKPVCSSLKPPQFVCFPNTGC